MVNRPSQPTTQTRPNKATEAISIKTLSTSRTRYKRLGAASGQWRSFLEIQDGAELLSQIMTNGLFGSDTVAMSGIISSESLLADLKDNRKYELIIVFVLFK